jgi:MerR family transcriptional regulator/heat shock protein HspR
MTSVAAPSPWDDDQMPLFTVGQVAQMLGVQPAFVRRLDSEQVVQPARSEGGQRRYTRAEIAIVQQVSDMADEGMTLAGIRRILMLELEVTELRRQVAELTERRATSARHRREEEGTQQTR